MKKRISIFLAVALVMAAMTVPASALTIRLTSEGTSVYQFESEEERQRWLDGDPTVEVHYSSEIYQMPEPTPTETVAPAETDKPAASPAPVTLTESKFTDVPVDAWYAVAVNVLAEGGLVQGVGEGKFAPTKTVTYAEFMTILDRLFGNLSKDANERTRPLLWNQYGPRVVRRMDEDGSLHHWAALSHLAIENFALKKTYGGVAVHPEDLDCTVLRAHAIGLITATYEHVENHGGYVHNYTKADIPDWDLVQGTDIKWDKPVYPIGDKLNFLPDKFVCGNNLRAGTYDGYNMTEIDSVAQNIINSGHPELAYKPLVLAHPDLVLKAYNYGLVQGIDANNTCGALNTLTRAELCQMLYNAGLTREGMCAPDIVPTEE